MTARHPGNHSDLPGSPERGDERKTCAEWEAALVEAARVPARSGSERAPSAAFEEALEHAETCPTCAERLAAERALSADLNLLAEADSFVQPSPGCEAVLLAAFRSERGREVRARRWIFAVAGTLAACLVILLGAALLISRDSGSLARGVFSRLPQLGRNPAAPAAAIEVLPGVSAAEMEDEDDEEVTDFYAFYPGADLSSVESGALVRVRVPSSELEAFGFEVLQGREEEWVNADLLVAEDGSPQAIRFVLPTTQDTKD